MSLSSLYDFQKEELVKNFLITINKFGDPLTPEMYGFSEPLKQKYNQNDISGPINCYMHEEVNRKLAIHGRAGGGLMMEKKKGDIFYNVEWGKYTSNPRHNFFGFSVSIDLLKKEENYHKFISICNDFAVLFKPLHGDIKIQVFLTGRLL